MENVIFDLDGTLADIRHRLHFIQGKKDYDSFFKACSNDKPITNVIEVLESLFHGGYNIWIVSGRSDAVKKETTEWLSSYVAANYYLVMRKSGDFTPDDELKKTWLNEGLLPQKEKILCVFDDRKRVVDMWREQGLTCFQVAEGNF